MKSRRAEKQNRDDLPDLQTRQETQESGFEGGDLSLDRFFGERIATSDLSARPAAGGIFGYGLSVVLVALSTGLTLLLQDYTFRTPLFLPAILLSTWFGGTGPGLLAVVLSTLSINFFILEPKFAFAPLSVHDVVHLVVFLFWRLRLIHRQILNFLITVFNRILRYFYIWRSWRRHGN